MDDIFTHVCVVLLRLELKCSHYMPTFVDFKAVLFLM